MYALTAGTAVHACVLTTGPWSHLPEHSRRQILCRASIILNSIHTLFVLIWYGLYTIGGLDYWIDHQGYFTLEGFRMSENEAHAAVIEEEKVERD